MSIYFLSNNDFKIREMQSLADFNFKAARLKIDEIQSDNANKIVEDKILKAYQKLRRPVFVEHTGLYINDFGLLPGGLTQVIWDSLKAEKFCEYFGNRTDTTATAKTVIAYCNGKNIKIFEGEINGNIAKEPRGIADFQWDCVFIPEGYSETFAELGDKKNDISMRKLAVMKFSKYLKEEE